MKITVLGAGAWGFCLANLLAVNGHDVLVWADNPELISLLSKGNHHPKLKNHKPSENMRFTVQLEEAVEHGEIVLESVTSKGFRPVLKRLLETERFNVPIIISSKGIEQDSGLLLSEVALEILGEENRSRICCLSGPSLAEEVMRKNPTSVVVSSYDKDLMLKVCEAFTNPYFRVYPNSDMPGVSFGGAMKNIIAIACGISDGLEFGANSKAALMTRGLHEIRKLGETKGCKADTLNGLSGMGDLCVTCLSTLSRNYIFGKLLAEGLSPEEAKKNIGMVVEGAYTCVSALQLSQKHHIPVPITEVIYKIVYENMPPKEGVQALLTRTVKEEHL